MQSTRAHQVALFLLATISAPLASAQHPYLVRDINTEFVEPLSSTPHSFLTVSGTTFFSATRADVGRELWKSAGGAAPELVLDIHPHAGSDPEQLFAFNGLLFFSAVTPAEGRELWVSNGTAAGTQLVIDLQAGTQSSDPTGFTTLNGEVYFAARGGGFGRELWKTDGTALGTELVVDLAPSGSSPKELIEVGGQLYFTASEPSTGRELWSSDGTLAGTQLVTDLVPGAGSSSPLQLSNCAGELYFNAEGALGREPYRVDGAGLVQLVADIEPGPLSSNSSEFTSVGGSVFFSGFDSAHGNEVWKTDGTPAGTEMTYDYIAGSESSNPRSLIEFAGQLLFLARSPIDGSLKYVAGDGTPTGSTTIATFGPGLAIQVEYAELGGELFLQTEFGLSRWDGVGAAVNFSSQQPEDQRLYSDGSVAWFGGTAGNGVEPWSSNGTGLGTINIGNVNTGSRNEGAGPHSFAEFNGELVFRVEPTSQGQYELWKSDGTLAGTGPLMANPPWDFLFRATSVGEQLFIQAYHSDQGEHPGTLWVSDGTEAGTQKIDTSITLNSYSQMIEFDNKIFFNGNGSSFGRELWVTDGVTADMLVDIFPGFAHGDPSGFLEFDGHLYFVADTSISGDSLNSTLFRTDGTAEGTEVVLNDLTDVFGLIAFGDQLILRGSTPGVTDELFALDTDDNLSLLLDIAPGVLESAPHGFTATDNGVVFRAASAGTVFGVATEWELWRTDGTAVGTFRLLDIGAGNGLEGRLGGAGGLAYFLYDTASGDNEVWRTDGTIAGTARVSGLSPLDVGDGDISSIDKVSFEVFPIGEGTQALVPVDQGWGDELWLVDDDQMVLFADISSAEGGADPHDLLRVGGHLFFEAEDDVRGRELYAIPFVDTGAHVAESFGQGCPGTGGIVPTIGSSTPPLLGGPFDVELENGLPLSFAALFHAYSRNPLNLGSCTLYIGAPFFLTGTTATDGSGAGAVTFNFPPTSALTGIPLYTQYLVADPAGAFSQTASFSNAMEILVGP